MKLTEEELARFWSRVQVGEPDECWSWLACLTTAGYGQIQAGSKMVYAHRISASIHGMEPKGFCVCHKCDNPSCVNPSHLFLGTHAENMADCRRKGRAAKGGKNGTSKLCAMDIPKIRKRLRDGESQGNVARSLGVDQTTIWAIAHGKTWVHA